MRSNTLYRAFAADFGHTLFYATREYLRDLVVYLPGGDPKSQLERLGCAGLTVSAISSLKRSVERFQREKNDAEKL